MSIERNNEWTEIHSANVNENKDRDYFDETPKQTEGLIARNSANGGGNETVTFMQALSWALVNTRLGERNELHTCKFWQIARSHKLL